MQIMIDIPDEDIPKRQDVLTVDFVFIDGHISQCDYPFEELPKGHGNIYDENDIKKEIENPYQCQTVLYGLRLVKPIIEADRE